MRFVSMLPLMLLLKISAHAGVDLRQDNEYAETYRNVEEGRYFEGQNNAQDAKITAEQARAYVSAFYGMKEANPEAKIYFIVKGVSKSNIVNVKMLEGGTLLLITQKSGIKTKQEVIRVQDIEKLAQW